MAWLREAMGFKDGSEEVVIMTTDDDDYNNHHTVDGHILLTAITSMWHRNYHTVVMRMVQQETTVTQVSPSAPMAISQNTPPAPECKTIQITHDD